MTLTRREFIKHSGIAAGTLVGHRLHRYPHGQKRRAAKFSLRAVGER